jgi:phosphoribosyl 1,2-cyclic phosphodiesterase
MTLTFLGTRGNINVRSQRHRRHTSILVSHRRVRVMIDCGADWLRHIPEARPTAIVLTHAHSDHVDGLRAGAPCPVYATDDVWEQIGHWPLRDRRTIESHEPVTIGSIAFEPVPVHHSLRAQAVAYRITSGNNVVFYVPDVLDVPARDRALANVVLYVGDAASVRRPIQRSCPHGHSAPPGRVVVTAVAVSRHGSQCRREVERRERTVDDHPHDDFATPAAALRPPASRARPRRR